MTIIGRNSKAIKCSSLACVLLRYFSSVAAYIAMFLMYDYHSVTIIYPNVFGECIVIRLQLSIIDKI